MKVHSKTYYSEIYNDFKRDNSKAFREKIKITTSNKN